MLARAVRPQQNPLQLPEHMVSLTPTSYIVARHFKAYSARSQVLTNTHKSRLPPHPSPTRPTFIVPLFSIRWAFLLLRSSDALCPYRRSPTIKVLSI